MAFPAPRAGMVVRYAYLWRDEHLRGLEEGSKDRPCAILLSVTDDTVSQRVLVLPITRRPPDTSLAIEIPLATKRRLGLDDERSWVIISEANRFTWPGPDLRPIPSREVGKVVYGELPADFFRKVKAKWLSSVIAQKSIVKRTE